MANPEQAAQAAHKISQVLGEVLIHHAPVTAEINADTNDRHREAFLEDLETHTSKIITPFLTSVLDNAQVPESLKPVIEEALTTPHQFSAIVTQLFLYGIVSQLLGTSVQPFLVGVSNDLNAVAVGGGISVPVSPVVLATAAARGLQLGADPTIAISAKMYAEAAKSGVSKEDLDLQGSIVGTPPAPQELFELERRNLIQHADVVRGLKEGDTRDDWVELLSQLAHGWLTPLDFVRAAVQGQMSYEDAATWASKTGLDTSTGLPITASEVGGSDDMFGLAWAIAGRPPGPQELANMTLRGIIPKEGVGAGALSFQQGIAESDVKTKWTDALYELAQYIPPPGEIATLLEHGGIDHDQAVALWAKRGVPDEISKAYAYVTEQQHVTQDKLEAKGVILASYYDQIIDNEEATDLLGDLGFTGQVAAAILALQDFKRVMAARNAVVHRISALYGEFKISATDAKTALTTVGIPDGQSTSILQYYDALRVAPIRLPTTREIGLAAKAGTITQDEALSELGNLGYQDRDAAIVLSAYLTAKIAPLPAPGTTVTG